MSPTRIFGFIRVQLPQLSVWVLNVSQVVISQSYITNPAFLLSFYNLYSRLTAMFCAFDSPVNLLEIFMIFYRTAT